MAVSSAPGKVYLFGEHAVVYGEPAVPCAIERRVLSVVYWLLANETLDRRGAGPATRCRSLRKGLRPSFP